MFLQNQVAQVLDNDGGMLDAIKIDQSSFNYLKNHEFIAGKNIQSVFEQMEFDY
jgi:hypothetical protein